MRAIQVCVNMMYFIQNDSKSQPSSRSSIKILYDHSKGMFVSTNVCMFVLMCVDGVPIQDLEPQMGRTALDAGHFTSGGSSHKSQER